ncbi:MAG: type II toxin-antitoxin system RelE/ParE family toxin [Mariprofundaceae bacterium]|nr:type II toxin-antitoxin system RelE/ParE family toxin [Mariprofundaceae bacterium]
MKIKWLKTALKNPDQEAKYIAKDNPVAAANMVEKIMHDVGLLSSHPSLGRTGRIHGTRELIIDPMSYIIPYRMRGNNVEILRVFHASRKRPTKW